MITKKDGIAILEKVEDDEPVFILRAKDPISPMVVELYALQATIYRVAPSRVDEIRQSAREMRTWHEQHREKVLSVK